jgi:hypothetical protein
MDSIQFTCRLLIALFIYILLTKIFMEIAACLGEKMKLSKFFIHLWRKVTKNKKLLK